MFLYTILNNNTCITSIFQTLFLKEGFMPFKREGLRAGKSETSTSGISTGGGGVASLLEPEQCDISKRKCQSLKMHKLCNDRWN